ncbi:MAG: hypothetical protein IT569_09005 [Leptospiraceae bacterium]|nr:hypothetical protein [Leptospiraceae bacterium]
MNIKRLILSFMFIFFLEKCPNKGRFALSYSECKNLYGVEVSLLIATQEKNPSKDYSLLFINSTLSYQDCIQKAKRAEGLYGKIKGGD